MRPVRLTMQAFGPYSARQVVDFRDAVAAGLFGLYGPTGSGKSSVFSAMTFALFGEPAKSEQDAPSLRCDRAMAEMPTEVELVFDIGNRRYVARRRPDQSRPKKRGEGETRVAHEAYLFDASGMAPEEITADRCGKVIAEKKVGTVNAAIIDLLGYRAEQFRQIVLLPQGRFETFLSANTKERVAILRDLFDVSVYRTLAAQLKQEAEAVERETREERAACTRRLAMEGFESPEALKTGIEAAQAHHAALSKDEATAHDAFEAARSALQTAQKLAGQFEAAGAAQSAFETLQGETARIEALKTRIERVERARPLLDLETRVEEAAQGVHDAGETVKTCAGHSETANALAEEAGRVLQTEIARTGEVEALRDESGALDRHAQSLADSAEVATLRAKAEAAEQEAARKHAEAATALAKLHEKAASRTTALDTARLEDGQRQRLLAQIGTVTPALAAARDYAKTEQAVRQAEAAVTDRSTDHEKARQAAGAARAIFEQAERALTDVQALHLASKLVAGVPCPVCGAPDHPAPATGEADHAGLDQTFRDTRRASETADAAERAADTALQTALGLLRERQGRLDTLPRPGDSIDALDTRLSEHRRALDALGPAVDIGAATADLAQVQEAIRDAGAALDGLARTLAQCTTAAAVARTELDTMLAPVPDALRDPATLARKRKRVAEALAKRLGARDEAEKAAQTARDTALSARKDHESAENDLVKCRKIHEAATTAFTAGLAGAALSAEAFLALKPALETLEADRGTVSDHAIALGIARETAATAAAAIKGLSRPDLSAEEARVAGAQQAATDATDARAQHQQKLAQLTRLRDDLADTLRRLDAAEEDSGPLRTLAALCNGANEQNHDLETYAIGAMFDRVLEATNLRYGPMTQHRYRLERDFEGTGRGRRGLGTQVFDTHTGKTRPTATLSGGESFIAALALALGLADIVESANGKVRLDTVFIDEGFGSLDTENGTGTLDRVLHVLRSLVSQNRAVGLISHVPLVQEAIPNGFYVHKSPDGSHIEAKGPF